MIFDIPESLPEEYEDSVEIQQSDSEVFQPCDTDCVQEISNDLNESQKKFIFSLYVIPQLDLLSDQSNSLADQIDHIAEVRCIIRDLLICLENLTKDSILSMKVLESQNEGFELPDLKLEMRFSKTITEIPIHSNLNHAANKKNQTDSNENLFSKGS